MTPCSAIDVLVLGSGQVIDFADGSANNSTCEPLRLKLKFIYKISLNAFSIIANVQGVINVT